MIYPFFPHKPKLAFFVVVVVKRVHVKQLERKPRGSICRTDGTLQGNSHPPFNPRWAQRPHRKGMREWVAGGRAIKPSLIMAWVESSACLSQLLKVGPGDARDSHRWRQGLGRFLSEWIWKGQTNWEVPTEDVKCMGLPSPSKKINKPSCWRNQIKATRESYGTGTQMAEKSHPSSS